MPDQDVRQLLERAEQAAADGDLMSADELLRSVARVQERELGPTHPDLANTINNLAIVAERTGRLGEAETFYRRAVSIAEASLPPGDPMLAASRQNLEDFCRAHGLPIETPAPRALTPETGPPSDAARSRPRPDATAASVAVPPERDAGAPVVARSAAPQGPPHAPQGPTAAPARPSGAPSQTVSQQPSVDRVAKPRGAPARTAWTAIAVVVVAAIVLLIARPWSSRDAPPPASTSGSAPQPSAAATPPPSAPSVERTPRTATTPNPPSRGGSRNPAATGRSSAPSVPGSTLMAAQVCRNFSTSGRTWRCDPVGNSVAPERLVLFTRVKSPRSTVVVHRWYRDETLRQSVRLEVGANPTEGYRTYSRQTVDRGAWRVEVRSADGALLHEQRFTVR